VLNHAQDESELGVVDADDQQAAGVRPSRSRPFGGDPGEVPDIEGDHDPSLVGRERKKLLILPTVELAFLVRGTDVMLLPQGGCDAAPGDVRVEEQLHGLSVADGDRVDRWVLALELSERSLALADRGVDLVRKLGVVGEREPDLWLRQIGRASHLARRAVRA